MARPMTEKEFADLVVSLVEENDRLRAALERIESIDHHHHIEGQTLDYLQGYRDGESYMAQIAADALAKQEDAG